MPINAVNSIVSIRLRNRIRNIGSRLSAESLLQLILFILDKKTFGLRFYEDLDQQLTKFYNDEHSAKQGSFGYK